MLTVQITGVVSFGFLPGLWLIQEGWGRAWDFAFLTSFKVMPSCWVHWPQYQEQAATNQKWFSNFGRTFDFRPHIFGSFRKWQMTRCHPSESDLAGLRRGLSTGFSEVFLIDSKMQPKLRAFALEQWFFSYSCCCWSWGGWLYWGDGAEDALNILWCTDAPQTKDDFTCILIAPRLRNPGREDVARSAQFIFICFLFTYSFKYTDGASTVGFPRCWRLQKIWEQGILRKPQKRENSPIVCLLGEEAGFVFFLGPGS